MKKALFFFCCICLLGFASPPVHACNLSDLSLTSVTWDNNMQEWVIDLLLNVGGGRTGVVKGADNDTRSISFGFYKNCQPLTLNSFLPSTITGIFTACPMAGTSLGAQGAPYNTQQTLIYIDPGYYGIQPCVSQPFACVTSTALCGNVTQAPYNFTFRTNRVPDSIKVFGVEGGGSATGGCFGNSDMMINFCTLGYCGYNIVCPGNQLIPAGPSCTGTLPNYISQAGVNLNCIVTSPPTITQSPTAGTVLGGLGSSATVTLQATFPGMNTASCSFTATVADLTPPLIICPGNTTLALNASCQATLPNYTASASVSDNCTASPALTQSPAPGTVITGGGQNAITLTATDAAGNSSTCSFNVLATESIPPTITCPSNTTVTVNAGCVVSTQNYTLLASASDNCSPSPVITQSPAAGTILSGIGTTTVTLTATDGAGNTATCTFSLNRVDQTPPTITCPVNINLALNASCQATLPDYTVSATGTDNCGGFTYSQSPAIGTLVSGTGTTTITLAATDVSGNSSTCSFVVTRVDQTAPILTCPPNATVSLNASCQATLGDYLPSATISDNCTAVPSTGQSPAVGTILTGVGPHSVTLSATDAAGNTGTCSFTVTGIETTPPTITCPANAVLTLNNSCQASLPDYTNSVTSDNCPGIVTVTQSPAIGTLLTGPGSSTVTLTATDGSGNTATCTFVLTASPPAIAATTQSPANPCQGDVVILTAASGGASYTWSTGTTGMTAQVTTTGWYWVDVLVGANCYARDSIFVSFAAAPQPVLNQVGNQICTGTFATYQWFLNGNTIPGATGSCVQITGVGTYSVTVTDANGCSGTGTFTIVGLEQGVSEFGFSVYPVPASDRVYLALAMQLDAPAEVMVYDVAGKVVRKWTQDRLESGIAFSLEGLADGTYFLEVRIEGWKGVRKVLKME